MEHFHSSLLLNIVIDKLHFLLKPVKNRLNEVLQHAAHCPYLVDNPKHGHWNFTGKYLKSANFSYCSLNVDSVLGYCVCLYYLTLTERTLVCEEWGNVEMRVNFFQFIAYVKTLTPITASAASISPTATLFLRISKKPLLITISLSEIDAVYN